MVLLTELTKSLPGIRRIPTQLFSWLLACGILILAAWFTGTLSAQSAALTVLNGAVRLVATTWEWADQIDAARAEASRARAEETLARQDLDARELELAQARLKRALVRTSVARM